MKAQFSTLFSQAQRLPLGPNRYGAIVERSSELFGDDSLRIRSVRDLSPIPKNGLFVLLGVAVYSAPEVQILDVIAERWQQGVKGKLQLFDILTCKTESDIQERIPGIDHVVATPVLGIWKDAGLIDRASGRKAVEMIRDPCGLSRLSSCFSPHFLWPYAD